MFSFLIGMSLGATIGLVLACMLFAARDDRLTIRELAEDLRSQEFKYEDKP